MKVFISHSSSDKWVARQIAKQLGDRGIDSFLDEKDIETGDVIDETIQEHLADCDELLMLLSPAALKSPWVLMEIGGAKVLRKRLIPILVHVGTNDLPHPLAAGLARDLNEIEDYLDEVSERSNSVGVGGAPYDAEPLEARVARPAKEFSVGDRVRLPRVAPTHTLDREGNEVSFNRYMENFLGMSAEVVEVMSHGWTRIDLDNGDWVWLMDWLEPLDPVP
jgi:hypothetical protein